MTYVIALPCVDVKIRACVDECPVDCIYEGERMLYIHPDECVDCGACEPVCPVEAIYYEDDTPAEWADYYDINVEFLTNWDLQAALPNWASSPRTTRWLPNCHSRVQHERNLEQCRPNLRAPGVTSRYEVME